jgi:hypothetical protein
MDRRSPRKRFGFRPIVGTTLTLLALAGAPALADVERQATILARAFGYEYTLKTRAGDSVVLGVLYKAKDPQSEGMADDWLRAFRALSSVKVQGLPFSAVKVPFENSAGLRASVQSQHIEIIFVCDKLDGDIAAIKELSHSKKLLTVAGKIDYLQAGLTLGVFADADRNSIQVNLGAARDEGVSFSSDLLRLAKIVK